MRPAQRVYRALLRAYPARTRDARGDDMAQLFADQLRDAPTPLDQARVWVAAVADIAIHGSSRARRLASPDEGRGRPYG